jgi:putative salt-induced outer membrane protein YdiY
VRSLLLLVLLSTSLFADQVVLKNGDKISGSIVSADGKQLVIKTDYADEVTIQWEAVDQLSSAQTLHIATKAGGTLVGPVSTANGNIQVATKSGNVEATKDSITVIRTDAAQLTYERSLHPGWLEGWNGGANVGFALTRGNSQSKNLSLAFNAVRKTTTDKLTSYANTVYATNDAPGATPRLTADAIQGGLRYDHDLAPRLFAFASADFQSDSLQTLNLRSVLGGGLGFHAIKQEATTLDFLGGINYTREDYDAFRRNFAAASIGEEFMHKMHAATVITQSAYVYPNISDAGDYRATFNLGTVTKLSKWLGWQNAIGDIYVSNPPAGKKQNDLLFTTGLNVSFTR